MGAESVIRGLKDPSPCFICRDLNSRSNEARYRVPLANRPLDRFLTDEPQPEAGKESLADLPNISSVSQMRKLLKGGEGLGLWVAAKCLERLGARASGPQPQEAAGAVIVFPPHEWEQASFDLEPWISDHTGFEDLPYDFDEVLPFAGLNFSPDRWLLVLDGPMAGNICWWTHDGDSVLDVPWAEDIKGWADRLFAEAPDVLGGIARYEARDSLDKAPRGASLFPVEYRRDCGAEH